MARSTIFVAGSRQISRLPTEVKARLDTMIEKGFQILVGDANGADKAVQRYFADKAYPHVLVHCMKDHCRNNIGTGRPVRSQRRAARRASTIIRSRIARWPRPPSTGSCSGTARGRATS